MKLIPFLLVPSFLCLNSLSNPILGLLNSADRLVNRHQGSWVWMTRVTVRSNPGLHNHFTFLYSPSSSQYLSTEQEERRPDFLYGDTHKPVRKTVLIFNATQHCAELLLLSSRPKTPSYLVQLKVTFRKLICSSKRD